MSHGDRGFTANAIVTRWKSRIATIAGGLTLAMGVSIPTPAAAQGSRPSTPCTTRPCTVASSVIAPVVTFEQAFTVERRLTLQTPGSIPFDRTTFQADPAGGFLVAFGGPGGTYRRYALDGSLLWEVPRASIQRAIANPTKVARISENQILLGQQSWDPALIWNEESKRVERAITVPLGYTNGGVLGIGRGTFLAELVVKDADDLALHLVDAATGRLQRSFFRPPVNAFMRAAVAATYGWTATARRGDSLATVFAFSDTIYLHDSSGTLLEKIKLPTGSFARPTRAPAGPDREAISSWLSSVAATSQIFWLRDGSFVVEYHRAIGPNQKRDRCFLFVARNGDGVLDLQRFDSTIRIVDEQGLFYFEDPEFKGVRSRMLVARLKPRE